MYTGKAPLSKTGQVQAHLQLMHQLQVLGWESVNTSTRPSLQIVKSPASRFDGCATIAGLTLWACACGALEHAHRDELPAAAISNISKFDMSIQGKRTPKGADTR